MSDIAYSLEAEKSVLGAILIDPAGAIPQVVDTVKPEDFYIAGHGPLYARMLELYATAGTLDYVTVLNSAQDVIPDVMGEPIKEYLLELAQFVPSIAAVKQYAEIVRKSAMARKLRDIVMDATYSEITADNAEDVAESIMSRVYGISDSERRGGLQPLRKLLPDWYMNLFKPQQHRTDSGYTDLDSLLNGLCGDELIILAARPAVGKTAFALSIAERVAKRGQTAAIYSYEMSNDQLIERMVAAASGVEMNDITNGPRLVKDQDKVGQVAKGVDALHAAPILLSDDAGASVAQIMAQSRMVKNLGLIVVDYIQLMQTVGRHQNRNDAVGEISRGLKLTAKALHVPVLALSQLNREVEHRGVQKPCIADLRDSGAIEQDADKIIFGWKPDPDRNIVEWDVAKNRRGKIGGAQFVFDGAHMAYTPLVRDDYIKPKAGKARIDYDNGF